ISGDVADDAGIFLLNPLAGRRLHHPPGSVVVGIDHSVPPLRGEIESRLRKLAAGVIDQHIEPPEALMHALDKGLYLIGAADSELPGHDLAAEDRKSTRLNSSHVKISYAVF